MPVESTSRGLQQAENGSPANFMERPVLSDKPLFLPDTSPPLETLFSLFPIYFDRTPWTISATGATQ